MLAAVIFNVHLFFTLFSVFGSFRNLSGDNLRRKSCTLGGVIGIVTSAILDVRNKEHAIKKEKY